MRVTHLTPIAVAAKAVAATVKEIAEAIAADERIVPVIIVVTLILFDYHGCYKKS